MRIVDLGRAVERAVAILAHERRTEVEPAAGDAVRQYTPPPGQVWVGAAASRHLRGRRDRDQPDAAQRDHAHHPLEHHQTPIQLADSANARRLAPTATDLFIHPPSRPKFINIEIPSIPALATRKSGRPLMNKPPSPALLTPASDSAAGITQHALVRKPESPPATVIPTME